MGTDSKSDIIIEASTRVFPRLGYHKATVEDILQEANVARSTFYVYFSNKREIFMSLVTTLMGEMLDITKAGIDDMVESFNAPPDSRPTDDEIMQQLVEFLAEVFRFIETNRGLTRIFFNDLAAIDDEMTQLFRDFQAQLTNDFLRLIQVGMEIGFLRQVNQRRAAEFIVAGLIHLARNISAGIGDYDVDDVSREIVDMQINGLRPVPARVGGGR
ncbi:MAG: TetR/AcrR family transcriptional regulator [Candidatus Geothermincolia bacterium]